MEEEIEILTNMLKKLNDISEEEITSIINGYIISDPANRAKVLMMIKDRLKQEHQNDNKGSIKYV